MLVSVTNKYSFKSYLEEMRESFSLRLKKAGLICIATTLICFLIAIFIQFGLGIGLIGVGLILSLFVMEYVIKFTIALVLLVLFCIYKI